MPKDLESFAHLWDGSEPGWVLLKRSHGLLAYNRINQVALLIDNDELNARVCDRMKDEGVEVFETLPKP